MKLRYIYEVFLFVALILFQVLLLNRINVFGYAASILYSYFLMKLPIGRNLFYVIISGFLMGFIIDIFLNTPGMNAAATTIVAAFRKQVLNLFYEREEYEDFVPGIHTSAGPFIRFVIFFVLFHLTLLFFIESFTFFNAIPTLFRIASSSLITILIIIALDTILFRKKTIEQT